MSFKSRLKYCSLAYISIYCIIQLRYNFHFFLELLSKYTESLLRFFEVLDMEEHQLLALNQSLPNDYWFRGPEIR